MKGRKAERNHKERNSERKTECKQPLKKERIETKENYKQKER